MNSTMRNHSEKRDFIRMKVDTQIELRVSGSEKVLQGICRDLSGTGMAVEVDEDFAVGTRLLACLSSSNNKFPPFEANVQVIRSSTLANGRYLVGMEIQHVAD